MPLLSGTRLGAYEIVALIGSGGSPAHAFRHRKAIRRYEALTEIGAVGEVCSGYWSRRSFTRPIVRSRPSLRQARRAR